MRTNSTVWRRKPYQAKHEGEEKSKTDEDKTAKEDEYGVPERREKRREQD